MSEWLVQALMIVGLGVLCGLWAMLQRESKLGGGCSGVGCNRALQGQCERSGRGCPRSRS